MKKFIVLVVLIFTVNSCSKKSPEPIRNLKLRLTPSENFKPVKFLQALNEPQGINEINCVGVFIGYDDGSAIKGQCTKADNTVFNVAEGAGLTPFIKTGTDLVLPAVFKSRPLTGTVIGFRSTNSTCPDFESNFDPESDTNFSKPYILGTFKTVIEDDVANVNVTATFDSANRVSHCDDIILDVEKAQVTTFGNGSDGEITIGSSLVQTTVDVSQDTSILGGRFLQAMAKVNSASPDGRSVNIGSGFSSDKFQIGDEVLFHIGSASTNSSASCSSDILKPIGKYAFRIITDMVYTTGEVTLNEPIFTNLQNLNVVSDGSNVFCQMQMIRVPNLRILNIAGAVTLNTTPFDFASGIGGIIAIKVSEDIFMQESTILNIDLSKAGFPASGDPETQGSSQFGLGSVSSSNNGMGGGAGLSVPHAASGGASSEADGGKGAAAPSDGGGQPPTSPSCSNPETCLLMGGAGGIGSDTTYPAGDGGGIVLINAKSVDLDSSSALTILASGGDGQDGAASKGPGGGGAGVVYLKTTFFENETGSFHVDNFGGDGGSASLGGGSGGGGLVKVKICEDNVSVASTLDNDPGTAGTGGTPETGSSGNTLADAYITSSAFAFCSE